MHIIGAQAVLAAGGAEQVNKNRGSHTSFGWRDRDAFRGKGARQDGTIYYFHLEAGSKQYICNA